MTSRDAHAERIAAAMAGMEAAKTERDEAVAAALKADLSVREVAAISGMSTATVQKIGHANGWPTPAQRKRWHDKKAADAAWLAKYAPHARKG